MALSGGQFLQDIRLESPRTALLFERLINGINNMAQHLGVDPQGKNSPPHAPNAINVSAGDGMVHVTHTDNTPTNKNTQWFTDWSNDSGKSWHQVHHNSSREVTIPLAAKAVTGGATHNYIFRGYKQQVGSDPSEHTYFGSRLNPTVVNVTGTTAIDYLPAVGGGTNAPNGQQGSGLGTDLLRPAQTQKRPPLTQTAR
jgi:hypothetical protein